MRVLPSAETTPLGDTPAVGIEARRASPSVTPRTVEPERVQETGGEGLDHTLDGGLDHL